MNFTKLKYQLQVLINPPLWTRSKTSKEFDRWLWNKMEEGVYEIKPHYYDAFEQYPSKYCVEYAGKTIWVSNAPYYDISTKIINLADNCLSSRATALRFRRMYRKYLKDKQKEVFEKEFK